MREQAQGVVQESLYVRLKKILRIQNGYAFESELFNDCRHGVPIIRIRDLAKRHTETFFSGRFDERFIVRPSALLIGMDGEFRCYRWNGPEALLNQRVCRLQDFSANVLPDYIFYGINEHLAALEAKTDFVTVKHLSSKQIENIRILLPPLSEQSRIVQILDEAEEWWRDHGRLEFQDYQGTQGASASAPPPARVCRPGGGGAGAGDQAGREPPAAG